MAPAITALLWTLVFLLSPAGTASARAVVANKTDGYEDRLANRSYQSERPTHILGCDSRTRPSERTSSGTYGRIVVDGGVATSSGDRQIGVKDPTTGRTTGWFYNTIHQLEYIVEHIPGVTAASDILSVLPATQDYKTKYVYYTSGTGKGRVSEVHDAEGQTTLYTYTAKGQVATVRGTGQKPVDYIYDSAYGDLLELRTYYTFPGTYLKRTWQYEAASGLLRAKTGNSLSSKEEFEYYPSGALKVRENVRNARVTYTYTAYGDLKKIDYPDTATPDVTYTAHYRSGRPKTITDGAGTKTLTYDLASGGVTGETYTSGLLNGVSVSRGFSSGRLNTLSASWSWATIPGLTYSYSTITGLHDAITRTGTTIKAAYRYRSSSAQVTERIFTNGGGERLRTILDFNPQNQLRAISNQRGGRAFSSHVYRVMDKLHRRKIVDREDGTQWHYAYNTEGEVIKAGKYRNATEPLAGYQFRFTFDDASNREQRSRGGNATEGGGLITESYSTSTSDDIADQYTQVTHSPAFDILGQAGNPASVTVTTDISGTTTEQVDQSPWWRQRLTHTSSSSPRWGEATVSHALASRTGDYYLPPGTETLSYDADGNLSGDARWTYTWDNQNRLIKMETKSAVITAGAPNDVLEFTYDGVNRRVRKKFIRNGSTVYDEYYLYDGWNITGRFRGSSVTKTLIQKYAWGLDASGTLHGAGGVGGLLWVEDAATTTTRWFPAYDGNGNVMALLEDNANSATAGYLNLFHEYGPFGESLSKRGVMDSFGHNCPFQFSTKWTDEETGLIYYGHRYYDPKHGRWLSRDPIGEAGGVNLYGFVGNDGVNRIDSFGLYPGMKGHGEAISPTEAVKFIKNLQDKKDKAFDARLSAIPYDLQRDKWLVSKQRNSLRLGYIIPLAHNPSGPGRLNTNDGNRFVYTCKYGWIDMGHFFRNANGAYHRGSKRIKWFADKMELLQEKGIGDETSAWGPEDLISNDVGRKFGVKIRKLDEPVLSAKPPDDYRIIPAPFKASDFANIQKEWGTFLRDSGAVAWSKKAVAGQLETGGEDVRSPENWIKHDISMYSSRRPRPKLRSIAAADRWFKKRALYRCLCKGDRPKYKEHEFQAESSTD